MSKTSNKSVEERRHSSCLHGARVGGPKGRVESTRAWLPGDQGEGEARGTGRGPRGETGICEEGNGLDRKVFIRAVSNKTWYGRFARHQKQER